MDFQARNHFRFFTKYLLKAQRFKLALLLLCANFAQAQTVTVIDAFTQQPLEQVMVINQYKDRYTTTNEIGRFELSQFLAEDQLSFQLMGYENLNLTSKEIEAQNHVVALFLDEKKLGEIVLSVARTAAQSQKIAEHVSLIDKTAIQKEAPTTGADLLLMAPGVRLQKSQGGGGSPILRGFEANRVLLVVDGIRMNNAIYRSGHLQNAITVDPNSIERVEVIYGASSVGYGSDALGGVVHYYTKTPKINNKETMQSMVSSNFNSAQNAFIQHFETEASLKNWASFSSLTYSDFGDIRMGKNRQHGYNSWGLVNNYSANNTSSYFSSPTANEDPNVQKNSGYSQLDLLQKFVVNLPNESQLLVNLQFSNSSNIPRFDKLNESRDGTLRFAEWFYGPQKRLLISPQLKLFPRKKLLYKGTVTTAFQQVDESRIKRNFASLSRETQKEKVDVFSINGDFEMAKTERFSVAYGFEWVHNRIQSEAFAVDLQIANNRVIGQENQRTIPTRYPSDGSRYAIIAGYGNFRFDLNDKTTVALGTRLTNTQLNAAWNDTALIDSELDKVASNNTALTGSFSIAYRPSKDWRINLLASSGFRSPNVDDLGKIREDKGMLLVPNPDLAPEYVYTYDGGVSYHPIDKTVSFNLRFYNSLIRNYIGRMAYPIAEDNTTLAPATIMFSDEIVTTQANANIGNGRIYGFSFEGGWRISNPLSATAQFTYTAAAENLELGPLPSILPYYGGVDLKYTKEKFSLLLRQRFNSSKSPEHYSLGGEDGLEETPMVTTAVDPSGFAGSPRWISYSFLGQYRVTERLSLNAAIENIFDLHYRSFASGISAPGRSLNLGGQFRF